VPSEALWPPTAQAAPTGLVEGAFESFIDHHFRRILPPPADFFRMWRVIPRIASQPPLLGVSTEPNIAAVDAAPTLLGVSTEPELTGQSTAALLIGVSTEPTLRGQV